MNSPTLEIVPGHSVANLRSAKPLAEEFADLAANAEKLACEAASIAVTDASQKDMMASAKDYRLMIRDVRLKIEKKHQEVKAFYLDGGRKVDAMKNALVPMCKEAEERLRAAEEFVEREQARARQQLQTSRLEMLGPYEFPGSASMTLHALTEDEWTTLLASAKEMHAARREAAKKAEEERMARAAAAAAAEEEAHRLRVENTRMKMEAARAEAELHRANAARVAAENLAARATEKVQQVKAAAAPVVSAATPSTDLRALADSVGKFSANCLNADAVDALRTAENAIRRAAILLETPLY